jgi:hypothetical protein
MPKTRRYRSDDVYKLHNGRWAPIPFYNALKKHVAIQLETMKLNNYFTLKQLCSKEFWDSIDPIHLRRIAGGSFRTMVEDGDFPLKMIRFGKNRTNYYYFSN